MKSKVVFQPSRNSLETRGHEEDEANTVLFFRMCHGPIRMLDAFPQAVREGQKQKTWLSRVKNKRSYLCAHHSFTPAW